MEVEDCVTFNDATDELSDFVSRFDATHAATSTMPTSASPFVDGGDEWHDAPDSPPRQRMRLGMQRDQSVVVVDSLRDPGAPQDRAERLQLLYTHLDVRALQLIAGHADRELLDLLDEQRLQNWQRELQAAQARQRRAQEPFRELEQRQRMTREQLDRLERDQSARQQMQVQSEELVESASLLTRGPAGLWSLSRARRQLQTATLRLDPNERQAQMAQTAQKRGQPLVGGQDLTGGMRRHVLHKYVLSRTSRHLLIDTLREARQTLESEWPLFQDAVQSPQALGAAPRLPPSVDEDWRGTPTVSLGLAAQFFGNDAVDRSPVAQDSMPAKGSLFYARRGNDDDGGGGGGGGDSGNSQYVDLMRQFISPSASNIVTSTFLQAEHPATVQQLLARIPGRTPNDLRRLREVVAEHLVWLYLERSSLQQLALDATDDRGEQEATTEVLSEWLQRLETTLQQQRQALALYLSWLVRQALLEAMRPLIRLPQRLALATQPIEWDTLTRLLAQWGPERLIVDDAFRRYFTTGRDPYQPGADPLSESPEAEWRARPEWQRRENAALALHVVFTAYLRLLASQQRHDTERRQRLQQSLEELVAVMAQTGAAEVAPSVPSLTVTRRGPEYTGVLLLKPYVRATLEQAYNTIQRYCPGLRGLPFDEYQAEHAFASGLADAHARLVAALVAETQLTFPAQYKTQHQQDLTLRKTTDAVNALKRFRYARNGTGYVSRQDQTPQRTGSSLGFSLGL